MKTKAYNAPELEPLGIMGQESMANFSIKGAGTLGVSNENYEEEIQVKDNIFTDSFMF